jgi:SAM-dependent methyltransferase
MASALAPLRVGSHRRARYDPASTLAGLPVFAVAAARSLQVAQRVGIFAKLADGPATAGELARGLALRPSATELLLDTLCAAGVLRVARLARRGRRYVLPRRAARWLDPAGAGSIGAFVTDTYDDWSAWAELETLVRNGKPVAGRGHGHDRDPDDPHWLTHVLGQYELARLSSDALAAAVPLGPSARSLLDVAGGHGEHAMALCRRHAGLAATVVDVPSAARVGRHVVERAGLADRVRFVEGDMFDADLGGPHDGALAFNVVCHLAPGEAMKVFERIASALHPGAPLAVLDLLDRPGRRPDASSAVGLFTHLLSAAGPYGAAEVSGWLAGCGFDPPRIVRLPETPGLTLLIATRSADAS